MSVQLLDKTRKINRLLHDNHSSKVVFTDICQVMAEVLSSQVVVLSRKGKVLGIARSEDQGEFPGLKDLGVGDHVDPVLNERLLSILSTKENVNLKTLGLKVPKRSYAAIISPLDISGDRQGTLFLYREGEEFEIDDIILCEYGTTVVSLEIMRSIHEENAEEDRKVHVVQSAVSTLSFSELEAVSHIFEELGGKEGVLVASRVADRVGITRSVIVNALRKLESAGIIESRSSGMKGTYIKILNDAVFEELERARKDQ